MGQVMLGYTMNICLSKMKVLTFIFYIVHSKVLCLRKILIIHMNVRPLDNVTTRPPRPVQNVCFSNSNLISDYLSRLKYWITTVQTLLVLETLIKQLTLAFSIWLNSTFVIAKNIVSESCLLFS